MKLLDLTTPSNTRREDKIELETLFQEEKQEVRGFTGTLLFWFLLNAKGITIIQRG